MSDGTNLRANVFRPASQGRFPVILSAHPYGKDALPRHTPLGYLPLARYRFLRQPGPVSFSAYTSWEAPDPSHWVPRGYAVVNLDLRGFGTSEGTGTLLSEQEARDVAEAIEWAAAQPWSTGKVGLNGVSYLAISQWRAAALRPPHLAAICPWEGFSDVYRDLAYPGGVREDGFMPFWSKMTERCGRVQGSLRPGQLAHPSFDDYWAELVPNLERIVVPALICGSFSDQGLHARGAFEAFRRIGSRHRYLYTHRGGKWSTYYSNEALSMQTRFFDCFLKGEENGMRDAAPVRLEVRGQGDAVHAVRDERAWPLRGTRWKPLYLSAGELRERPADSSAGVRYAAPAGGVQFGWQVPEDLELAGPMKLKLHFELGGATDTHLFVAVRKLEGGRHVPFEGSYGFGRDVVTKGWMRVAHRRLDAGRSDPYRPFHPCDVRRRPNHIDAPSITSCSVGPWPGAAQPPLGSSRRARPKRSWACRRGSRLLAGPLNRRGLTAPGAAWSRVLLLLGEDAFRCGRCGARASPRTRPSTSP